MAYRSSCYPHSPHLNIPRSFKIVIYLILEHIYTSSINIFPWQSIPYIYRSLRNCLLYFMYIYTVLYTIYNVIDFVICRQAHKSILSDSRSYAGTLLDSDHRLLISKLDLRHLHNIWEHLGRPQPKKRVRFNTDELTNAPKRAQFREGVIESLADIDTSSPVSERWSQIKQALSSAAESTIGRSVPGRNPLNARRWQHCQKPNVS